MHEFVTDYIVFSSVHEAIAVVLWVLHTYIFNRFDSTPRLTIRAPHKASGKSRLMECLNLLCHATQYTSGISTAALFRIIEKLQPTILVDESDTIFGDKASDHEDLRGLIDAGHRKGVPFIRCHGQDMEPKAFNTFAPVALAGIGNLPATILDRSVIINLRRKSASEVVKPFRLTGDTVAKKRAAVITQRLAQWAETMKILEPMMPDGISDRSADVWEPLIAIADGGGDVWSKDGRDACRVMSGEWAIEDGNDPSLQLLRDLRAVFGESTRMATHSILLALMALPESPWQDIGYGQGLSNVTLAGLLKAYGVKPKSYRNGEKTERGYYRAMFTDLWVRYLGSAEARTSETVTAS